MTNDRFADPTDHDPDAPTHPNLARDDLPPETYRDFRIPSHVDLARIRYRHDPDFHEAVNVAYRWLDDTETPEDVFDRHAGRRIRITRNLLGDAGYYGGDVEPFVGTVFDDDRLDAFADWVDDPASGYAHREDPEWLSTIRASLSKEGKAMLDDAVERWNAGGVRKAELAEFAADMVDTDPVEKPSPAKELSVDDYDPMYEMRWRTVVRGIVVFAAILAVVAIVLVVFL